MKRIVTAGVFSWLVGATFFACGNGKNATTAINPLTGERRTFNDASEVPQGWTACADDNCPEPSTCLGLSEAACLLRSDCMANYAEYWPMECESPNPPAYCADLPYTGCGPIPTANDGVGCGTISSDGTVVPGTCDQSGDDGAGDGGTTTGGDPGSGG